MKRYYKLAAFCILVCGMLLPILSHSKEPSLSQTVEIKLKRLRDTVGISALVSDYSSRIQSSQILYRGRQAVKYSTVANGSNYWSDGRFMPGSIMYNKKHYDSVYMNIDAFAGNLEIKIANTDISLVLDPEKVEAFCIGKRPFIYMGSEQTLLPQGYYEVLYCGEVVLLKGVRKLLMSSVDNMNGTDGIGYDDPHYKMGLATYYKYLPYYYYLNGNEVKRLKRGRDILAFYPKERRAIKNYLHYKYNYATIDIERYIVEVASYAESLK